LVSNALKFTSSNGSVRLLLSVDGGIEASDSGDADIEIGRMNSTTSFFNLALGRSPLKPSVIYAETNHLVIRVQDSGVGISEVST
jgi:signal transduction histidine kinase